MRLPRDIGGEDLVRLLSKYGYEVARQTGSHIRVTTRIKGAEHHLTIPRHNPLKVGTLHGIISSIAEYMKRSREEVMRELFG